MIHNGHTLIPLDDFKAVLSLDDREDALSCFCLVAAAYTIEEYCMRCLVGRNVTDCLACTGDDMLTLREYPVRKILAVHAAAAGKENSNLDTLIDPGLYYCMPGAGSNENIPFSLVLQSAGAGGRYRVRYAAGYVPGRVPPDLASACLELAAWNMSRYRGQRIGMAGSGGKAGEQLEASMPENVRGCLNLFRN
jgi:hypothetical protein